jgi:1-acyl-sn-glycerol-3-phosphate acyltransferase
VPVRRDLYVRRFLAVARLLARWRFSKIDLKQQLHQRNIDGPLVLYANHPGFWDPIVCGLVSQAIFPQHHIYAPIDEAALKTHWYFNGLGFFGVEKDSVAGLRDFRGIGSAILSSVTKPCLIVTPEGRFTTPEERPIQFKRGLAYLLSTLEGRGFTAIPLALDYRKANDSRTVVWAYLGEPLIVKKKICRKTLQSELETRLEKSLDENARRASIGENGMNLLETQS